MAYSSIAHRVHAANSTNAAVSRTRRSRIGEVGCVSGVSINASGFTHRRTTLGRGKEKSMNRRGHKLAAVVGAMLFSAARVAQAVSCVGMPDGTTCDAGNAASYTLICSSGTCLPCATNPSAAPRFVDNGDGTITDRTTCLVWEKKDNAGGIHDLNNLYDWNSAATVFLPLLNNPASPFAGHQDWRLPTAAGRPGALTGQPAEIESIQASPSGCGATPGGGCVAAAFDTLCGPYGDIPPGFETFTTSHPGCTVDATAAPRAAAHRPTTIGRRLQLSGRRAPPGLSATRLPLRRTA